MGSTKDIKDVYVATRVAEIQTIVSSLGIQIMHVPTETNPADLLSRGCNTKKIKYSIWQHGPENVAGREFRDKFYVDSYLNTYDRE